MATSVAWQSVSTLSTTVWSAEIAVGDRVRRHGRAGVLACPQAIPATPSPRRRRRRRRRRGSRRRSRTRRSRGRRVRVAAAPAGCARVRRPAVASDTDFAQIEEAARRPDRVTGDRHSRKMRPACEVSSTRSLNVPGSPSSDLNDVTIGAGSVAAASHLNPVAKPAPPRPRKLERLISSRAGLRARGRSPRQRAARGHRRLQQRAGAPDIVLDKEELGRPVVKRRTRLNQLDDRIDLRRANAARRCC